MSYVCGDSWAISRAGSLGFVGWLHTIFFLFYPCHAARTSGVVAKSVPKRSSFLAGLSLYVVATVLFYLSIARKVSNTLCAIP
jgi:hypothetical protein